MTKIKLCGLSRIQDIETVNKIKPDYIGFVFFKKSIRYVSPEEAVKLKNKLTPAIKVVGVFCNEELDMVASMMNEGIIDIAQLHGNEDETYIKKLKAMTPKPIIKAYIIRSGEDIESAKASSADYILLDSGKGEGKKFDWSLLQKLNRHYFLAGGLNPENVVDAIRFLHPFAVDVSSGVETDKIKDSKKMIVFTNNVRKEDQLDKS